MEMCGGQYNGLLNWSNMNKFYVMSRFFIWNSV